MNKWLLTIAYLAVSVFLTRLIPFSSFFRNLDTMIHEFSHALVTLLLSGQVVRIELHADHSGVTYSRLASGWSHLPVAMAGYAGASLFALLLFELYARRRQKAGLVLMTLIAAVMLLLYVHTGFGSAWLIGFIALNVLVYFQKDWLRNAYYMLVAFLTLEESAIGPFSLILYALQDSSNAGDASSLQQMTGIPTLVWALAFTVLALACVGRALRCFWRERKPASPGPKELRRTAARL
ncbi:M50 family metallopeptidase [Cohnella thermotolerans]|uniref:M50 family metallopeptidase n=1 Tax=Cohnella thermotolerans TaxID=329858 RepID=UPI0004157A94|nr:M50 family metallopeptidase [Cohnella thermotolerans]